MDYTRANQQTGRIEPADELERLCGSGPPQRRLLTGSQALGQCASTGYSDTASLAMQYATIALLDGTVVGRLECDEALGKIVVGRSTLAEIQLQDSYVHRIHSEIHWDAGLRSHVITHAGGSNGTFVNLQRVDGPTRLIDGARIRIGKTELIYRRVYYPGG